MSTRTVRIRVVAVIGVALLTVGGILLAPARASRPSLVDALLGKYIVTLQDTADPAAVSKRQVSLLGGTVDQIFASAFKGYSASLTSAVVSRLLGDPLVKSVEPDARISLKATQANPPANIDRIDQRALPLSGSFTYGASGGGVRAYVIDTGVRRDHPDFVGRVTGGFNVLNRTNDTSDCVGHGTHVAGTMAGSTYGVAKGATIVPVKTFACSTTTTLSAVIAAIDWVTADHRPGQPAVANLSLTGGQSLALDRAIAALSNDGVAVAVAAGNEAEDACATSPARVPQVLTVAASDGNDAMPSFSNGGACVDLFAPGVRIVSIDHRTGGSAVMSGTSMATPHVSGALAVEMSARGTTAQQAQNRVLGKATIGAISGTGRRCGLVSGCRPATLNNRLVYIG